MQNNQFNKNKIYIKELKIMSMKIFNHLKIIQEKNIQRPKIMQDKKLIKKRNI